MDAKPESIALELAVAWEAHQQGSGEHASSDAFEHLHNAVSMLLTEWRRDRKAWAAIDQALNEGKGVYKP